MNSKLKKLLSFFLCCVLVSALMPTVAFAEEGVTKRAANNYGFDVRISYVMAEFECDISSDSSIFFQIDPEVGPASYSIVGGTSPAAYLNGTSLLVA